MNAQTQLALVKNSFSDFPGHLAAVIFLPGCNLRCPYCHNKNLVTGFHGPNNALITWAEAKNFLVKRAGQLSGLVISGGEALLHPLLPEIIAFAPKLGYKLKLDTNGTLPNQLAEYVAYFDYIAIDLKIEAHLKTGQATGQIVQASLNILNGSNKAFEVRSVVSPDFCGEEELFVYFPMVKTSRAKLWRLLPFRSGECLMPAFNNLDNCSEDFARQMQRYIERQNFITTTIG